MTYNGLVYGFVCFFANELYTVLYTVLFFRALANGDSQIFTKFLNYF